MTVGMSEGEEQTLANLAAVLNAASHGDLFAVALVLIVFLIIKAVVEAGTPSDPLP